LQSTNQIKLSNLSASQTPPFNSKHKQYDSVKRYMHVGKGIGAPGPFDVEAGIDQSTSHNRQKMLDARRAAEENAAQGVSNTYGLNPAVQNPQNPTNPPGTGTSPTVGQKFSLISNSAKIKQSGPIKAINMSVNNQGIGVEPGIIIQSSDANADKLLSQSIKIHNENSR
jgi:hypothetical protein